MPLGASRLSYLAHQEAAATFRTAVPITAYGNAQISTSQSKFGGGSVAFDGYNDYLSFPSGTIDDSATDFTYEGWFRFTILPQNQTANGASYMMIYSNNGTGGAGGYILLDHNGSERFIQIADSGSYMTFTDPGNNWAINTWYHIAVVRQSDQYDVYIDGSALPRPATSTKSGGFISGANGFIGQFIDPRGSINGYADEIRISSTARYTAGFTPHTTPHVNDANTFLLVHCDGTNGSTLFIDDTSAAPAGRTALPIGVLAGRTSATISTAQSKFGGSSGYFNNTELNITSPDFAFGTGDFTIEGWVYSAVGKNGGMFHLGTDPDYYPSSTNGLAIAPRVDNGNVWTIYKNAGIGNLGNCNANTWYHVALTRSNGVTKFFVDGVEEFSVADSNNYTGQYLFLGGYWTYEFRMNGYIDEFRISNNARYTANFAAPTAPFVNDANTLLLIHADDFNGSTAFIDDNT